MYFELLEQRSRLSTQASYQTTDQVIPKPTSSAAPCRLLRVQGGSLTGQVGAHNFGLTERLPT